MSVIPNLARIIQQELLNWSSQIDGPIGDWDWRMSLACRSMLAGLISPIRVGNPTLHFRTGAPITICRICQ